MSERYNESCTTPHYNSLSGKVTMRKLRQNEKKVENFMFSDNSYFQK